MSFLSIKRTSESTLKFNNIRVNKIEFHKSKQPIDLDLVTMNQIVVSDKFRRSDQDFRYFIGYQEDEIVKPLCIVLPQMSGYIKYFENGGRNMSFMIKNNNILDKYNEIWEKIKETLSIKFHSMPIYDQTYIKTKVREFDGKIKINLLGNEIPKENMHYTSIACIIIDFVKKMNKQNYLQVYLEECKYKTKKIQTPKFINAELESNSDSEPEKLKSSSDSE